MWVSCAPQSKPNPKPEHVTWPWPGVQPRTLRFMEASLAGADSNFSNLGETDRSEQGSDSYLDFSSYSGIKVRGDMNSATWRKCGSLAGEESRRSTGSGWGLKAWVWWFSSWNPLGGQVHTDISVRIPRLICNGEVFMKWSTLFSLTWCSPCCDLNRVKLRFAQCQTNSEHIMRPLECFHVTLLTVAWCSQSPASCQREWSQALAEQEPVGFRNQWPLKMWLWVLTRRSGDCWTLNTSPCTERWCWRTTETWSQWVRLASVSIKICALLLECGATEVCVCLGSGWRDQYKGQGPGAWGRGLYFVPVGKGHLHI